MEELQKRIAILERKIEREQKAKTLAENKLEAYSREIYLANRSLEKLLAKSQKREAELAYLNATSTSISSEVNYKELVAHTIEITAQFLEADCGFFLITESGVVQSDSGIELWDKSQGWKSAQAQIENICDELPLEIDEIVTNWSITPTDFNVSPWTSPFKRMLFCNFGLLGNKYGWIVFLKFSEKLDEDKLYILDIARKHLSSGINRRVNDIRINQRNTQLQDTVDKLEVAQRQLVQSEKMASLGQISAGIAHEINNPIGYVNANIESLKEYTEQLLDWKNHLLSKSQGNLALTERDIKASLESFDISYIEEDSASLLEATQEGIQRVADIVSDLKCFSHSGNREFAEVDLNQCIESALKISWNSIKYTGNIEKNLSPDIPMILGSFGQLQQVFVNLLVNAGQAIEHSGTITLSTERIESYIQVLLTDTGSGMDQDTMDKLFTPFFTTKPVGEGTGLGLSVSYSIIEAHDGKLTVASEPGMGTTFTLLFPILISTDTQNQ